jgi:hypothetical protein
MGLKISGGVICGRCGKPRGIIHECVPRGRRRRTRLKAPGLAWTCATCRKQRGLVHTCAPKSDFKSRKKRHERRRKAERKAERKREAAQRKREAARRRKAAAAARRKEAKSARAGRPRPAPHDYRTCRDAECPKYGCVAFRAGIEACPEPHGG